MKKILTIVIMILMFAVPASSSVSSGWWVQTSGKETHQWTNIQDDIDARIIELSQQYAGIDGIDGIDGVDGVDGIDGIDGVDGVDGQGVPTGGQTGEALVKNSNSDFDTRWEKLVTPSELQNKLNPIIHKNNTQDTRLGNVETVNNLQNLELLRNRLHDTVQDYRLHKVEKKNDKQDDVLDEHEDRLDENDVRNDGQDDVLDEHEDRLDKNDKTNKKQNKQIRQIKRHNGEQDTRLDGHDDKFVENDKTNTRQDETLGQHGNKLAEHDAHLGNLDNQMNAMDGRVSDLEKSQFILGLNIRIMDTKNTALEAFGDYSVTRSQVDRYGLRFTWKLGRSYEEELISDLKNEVEELKALVSK